MQKIVFLTCKNKKEAQKIGRALIEEKLASCVSFWDGVDSIYRWKGKIEETNEAILIVKCETGANEHFVARIKELHSYESPSIIEL